jgi:hypothetical protein
MDCRITSIKRRQQGLSLAELLIGMGLAGLVLAAVATVAFYSARSFAALTNYVDLDNYSRNALDSMTREIRQADRLVSSSDHELVFEHSNPATGAKYQVRYLYNPEAKTLVRLQGTDRKELLKECFYLRFSTFQRNPVGGSYDYYPWAAPDSCKLVQLSWICSRDILGDPVNTESVQSAKVVIRKQ